MKILATAFALPFEGGSIWYGNQVVAYGVNTCLDSAFRGSHRRAYTLEDAEAIVEWLREREAGYPPHEALMLSTAPTP